MRAIHQSGFSTLETLVAIAFLAICLAPLLAYQAQLASSAERLKHQSDLQAARHVAANYLMELSAADLPEGQLSLGGGWALSWSATKSAGPAPGLVGPGLKTRYSGELVMIEASLTDSRGHARQLPVRRLIVVETGPIAAE
jgi:hypothetical protein